MKHKKKQKNKIKKKQNHDFDICTYIFFNLGSKISLDRSQFIHFLMLQCKI